MYLGIGSIKGVHFHVRVCKYNRHLYFLELKTAIPKKQLDSIYDEIQRIYPLLGKSIMNFGQDSVEVVVWGLLGSESLKSVLKKLKINDLEAKLLLLNLAESRR